MEIDTRIVFRTPVVSGCATMVGNHIAVCDLRTMGNLLAEMAGDVTIDALHTDVIVAVAMCSYLDADVTLDPEFVAGHDSEVMTAMLGGF